MTQNLHTPVMLTQVVAVLSPTEGKTYVDATLGFGGHTLELLRHGASVIGLDRDEEILELATSRIKDAGFTRFTPVHSNFSALREVVKTPVNGILFDLGVSSYQLDTPERGFSFRFDAPLDMRMDKKNLKVTAADLINGLGRKELYELFTTLGEEYRARRLVENICHARLTHPILKTGDLVALIDEVLPRTGKIHPATKIFQALRMAVNSEREELKAALPSALSLLVPGGILAIISFHSLEDKIIKAFFASFSKELTLQTPKPIRPSAAAIESNPRCRSSKLYVIRRKI